MAFPLPQAIDPAVWTVGPGTGSVDLVSRVMSVPLGRSKHDALVRAHEMAHVRYSPRVPNVPKRHWLSYIFAEDGRIGLLAAAVGVATTPHVDTTIVEQSSPRTRARVILAMQALESREWASVMESLAPDDQMVVRQAMQVLREAAADPRASFDAACIIDKLPGRDPPIEGLGAVTDRWGELVHEQAPLRRAARRPVASTARPDEAGSALAFPHRYFLDGKVFARRDRRKRGKGSLLIDGSTSMRWAVEELDALVLSVPAVRAAIYAGALPIQVVQTLGYLRVVADDGAIADAAELFSPRHAGGNVVDFPALQWLSEQAPPRVWYSDGQVTGLGDLPVSQSLRTQVDEICATASIHRCTALAEATAYMLQHPAGA